ncbi:hypothetical protein [Roseicella sp. DB1501]|uniref:hypothetical protein n=1 Tax=Roseicella sp. DB1501 TaxID=2730925 RepID=UPI00149173BE|nr:hypothetical protein [Roseicella sp. DB1501]NOG71343.1 hypothetical protein [Roseicella sp. DB1501]
MSKRLMSHIGQYIWPWTIAMAVIGGLSIFGREELGAGYHLGDIAAVAFMISAACLIVISQRGTPRPDETEPAA